MELNLTRLPPVPLIISDEEIAKDKYLARRHYVCYRREQGTWSQKVRYNYAMCQTRWAKRVRDKLDSRIAYWMKQRGTFPDKGELNNALEQAYEAQSYREEEWGEVVSYWRTQYEVNKSK